VNEQLYVILIIILIVALVALQVLQTLLNRKAVEEGREQYPAGKTNELVAMFTQLALDLASKTPMTFDDAAVELYITTRGGTVETDATGRRVIVWPTLPPPPQPVG
jgi:hypothetical protein